MEYLFNTKYFMEEDEQGNIICIKVAIIAPQPTPYLIKWALQ